MNDLKITGEITGVAAVKSGFANGKDWRSQVLLLTYDQGGKYTNTTAITVFNDLIESFIIGDVVTAYLVLEYRKTEAGSHPTVKAWRIDKH